jgi:hypothetical protein
MNKIKTILIILALSLTTLTIANLNSSAGHVVYAACNSSLKDSANCGLNQASGGGANGITLEDVIGTIVNILSYVVGAVSIIMVVVSGFKYVTSNGDSNRVSSAKTTLVYALVGLAIAALAQFLVHFVLYNTSIV